MAWLGLPVGPERVDSVGRYPAVARLRGAARSAQAGAASSRYPDVAKTVEVRVARTSRGLVGLVGLLAGSGIEPGDVVRLNLDLSHEPPAVTVRIGEIELLHRAQYHGW